MLTAVAFLAFCLALTGMALVRHPIYGLYFYFATFFLHPPSRWWGSALPDLRWSLLAAVVTGIAIFLHKKKLYKPDDTPWYSTGPGTVLIILVSWMAIQSLWAVAGPAHNVGAIQYAKYLMVFWFVYKIADTPERMTKVLIAIVLGCVYLGWLCYQAPSSAYVNGRVNGVGGPGIADANSLSMMLAAGIVSGAVLLLSHTGWQRNTGILSMPLMLNGLILAASRGAFLAMAVTGLIMAFLKSKNDRLKFWLLALLALVALASLADLRFIERMGTVSTITEEDEAAREKSAQSRLVIMDAQVQMALAYPHGTGHKGTPALSPNYVDAEWLTGGDASRGIVGERSSHNTFLTLWVEQGIVGFFLYFAAVVWGVRCAFRLKRAFKRHGLDPETGAPALAATCCLATILVAGIFTDYFLAEIQIWMFAILASANARILLPLLQNPAVATNQSKYGSHYSRNRPSLPRRSNTRL